MNAPRIALVLACALTARLASAGEAPAAAPAPAPAPAAPTGKPLAVVLSVAFRGEGTVSPALRDTINGYLYAALDQLGYDHVDESGREAMLDADGGRLKGCLSTLACKFELARLFHAAMGIELDVVRAVIPVDEPAPAAPVVPEKAARHHGKKEKAPPPVAKSPASKPQELWQIAVALYPADVKTEGPKQTSEATYPSLEEVRTGLLAVLGGALAADRARGRATLHVTSTPAGAAVLIDDKPAGQTGATDIEHVIYAGKHHLRVQLDDKTFREEDVDVPAGGSARFAPDFSQPAPKKDCSTSAQKALRVLGPLLIGAGAGAAAYGGYALSRAGKLTDCADPAVPGSCASRVTATSGIAAIVPGGAAVITGAILTGMGFKKCKPPAVSLAPVVGPGLTAGTLTIDF